MKSKKRKENQFNSFQGSLKHDRCVVKLYEFLDHHHHNDVSGDVNENENENVEVEELVQLVFGSFVGKIALEKDVIVAS